MQKLRNFNSPNKVKLPEEVVPTEVTADSCHDLVDGGKMNSLPEVVSEPHVAVNESKNTITNKVQCSGDGSEMETHEAVDVVSRPTASQQGKLYIQ